MGWRWLVDFVQASGREPSSEGLRSYQTEAAKDKSNEVGDRLPPRAVLEG